MTTSNHEHAEAAQPQEYTEVDAWRDNYDGLFARWLECDTERLALKEALRDAELRIRILTEDRDEAAEQGRYQGWMPFGTCIDIDAPLEFSEPDEGGIPKWERINVDALRAAPTAEADQ